MRVLFVFSDYDWPIKDGVLQQSLELARVLAKSHQVEIAMLGRAGSEARERFTSHSGLARTGEPIVYRGPWLMQALWNALPVPPYLKSAATRDLIGLVQGDWDVVHAEGIVASAFVCRWRRNAVVSNLIDPGSRRHSRLARQSPRGFARMAHRCASSLFRMLELWVARRSPVVAVVSDSDVAYLRRTLGRTQTHVGALPLQVAPPSGGPDLPAVGGRAAVVGCFADLRVPHLRAAVIADLSALAGRSRQVPIRLRIFGRTSQVDVSSFEGVGVEEAELVDWVNDLRLELQRCDVVIVPDRLGTGIKNRALEVLSAGVPLVATPVALEGLPVRGGVEAFEYQKSADLGGLIDFVIRNPGRARIVARAGQVAVAESFGGAVVVRTWDELAEIASLPAAFGNGSR